MTKKLRNFVQVCQKGKNNYSNRKAPRPILQLRNYEYILKRGWIGATDRSILFAV